MCCVYFHNKAILQEVVFTNWFSGKHYYLFLYVMLWEVNQCSHYYRLFEMFYFRDIQNNSKCSGLGLWLAYTSAPLGAISAWKLLLCCSYFMWVYVLFCERWCWNKQVMFIPEHQWSAVRTYYQAVVLTNIGTPTTKTSYRRRIAKIADKQTTSYIYILKRHVYICLTVPYCSWLSSNISGNGTFAP